MVNGLATILLPNSPKRDVARCEKTGLRKTKKPKKQGLLGTARYKNGRPIPNFKTGALNHSATLPSPEFSDLAGAWVRGKPQLPVAWQRRRAIWGARPSASVAPAAPARWDADGLAERDSEQTGAQQHKAGRR